MCIVHSTENLTVTSALNVDNDDKVPKTNNIAVKMLLPTKKSYSTTGRSTG